MKHHMGVDDSIRTGTNVYHNVAAIGADIVAKSSWRMGNSKYSVDETENRETAGYTCWVVIMFYWWVISCRLISINRFIHQTMAQFVI